MSQIQQQKILLIDEESGDFEILAAILGSKGYVLDRVADIETALDRVKSTIPSIILLNVMVQGMKGYKFCEAIRRDAALPYIPIIFLTTIKIDSQEWDRGLAIGADDYLQKPFKYPELLGKIRAMLRIKSLYDELIGIRSELARYVSLPTLQMIERKIIRGIAPTAEVREVTILFSDLRGFTGIASQMDPAEVFRMLNYYLAKQIKIVETHHGTIDKLSGDEVMAVFDGREMVPNALRCGREIIKALADSKEYPVPGWLGIGVGVNTGPAHIGSLGTETFKKYTAIGESVNLAARLCGIAKKSQLLFSEAVRQLIPGGNEFSHESIGKVLLKGLPRPVEVFVLKNDA